MSYGHLTIRWISKTLPGWTALVERQAIFEALLAHGEQHFSQATHTPFASGPVADLLGPFEFNEYLQQILRSEFGIDLISDDIQL
jgi:hypothetical protein